jgi:hypothetical protein
MFTNSTNIQQTSYFKANGRKVRKEKKKEQNI